MALLYSIPSVYSYDLKDCVSKFGNWFSCFLMLFVLLWLRHAIVNRVDSFRVLHQFFRKFTLDLFNTEPNVRSTYSFIFNEVPIKINCNVVQIDKPYHFWKLQTITLDDIQMQLRLQVILMLDLTFLSKTHCYIFYFYLWSYNLETVVEIMIWL